MTLGTHVQAIASVRDHLGEPRPHLHEFTVHHKPPVVANTAVARELAGWCWSLATIED
ncbi:hypothetical protein [Nocardia sp. NPDC020380]|uniref:hypothetical protein n=1 Tax=Nocardia sp. NPDC020380 TaxID=3364309 RepID=UPI0037BCA9C4